jgi:hypothetical protein
MTDEDAEWWAVVLFELGFGQPNPSTYQLPDERMPSATP